MREVEARLKLSAVDRTAKAFDSVQRRLSSVEKKAGAVHRAQAALERSAGGAALAVGRVLAPAALAYGSAAAIKNFADFERQMNRIGITAGATVEQTKKASGTVQGLAQSMSLPLDAAISGFDTLVSSGMTLDEALAFLPSVLKTAQATGSATEDIANTALKASSALRIQASGMQDAFDIMVAGGKAGQFELKDMAAYIPGLANSFSSLGYSGEEGLKTLIALLQTIREDTGSAEAAATQAQNIFGKLYSGDTAKKFEGFGINLRKEMEAAAKAGEGAVEAFVRISKEAIGGDLTKLPLLFTDQEFRLGMQSLMTSGDSYRNFVDAVNGSKVKGTVEADFRRIADDTTASIQRMSGSWDTFVKSVGGAAAPTVAGVLDNLSAGIDNAPKADEIRKARGDSALYRTMMYGSSEDAALIEEYVGYDKMSAPGSPEAVRLQAVRNASNRGRLDQDAVSRRGVPVPTFRDPPKLGRPQERSEREMYGQGRLAIPSALAWAQDQRRKAAASTPGTDAATLAPSDDYIARKRAVQAARRAAAESAPSGVSDAGAVSSDARGALAGIVGRIGEPQVAIQGADELRRAMEAGGQSVTSAGQTAGTSIQAGGDAAAAAMAAALQQGASSLASAIVAALSNGVRISGSGALPRANAAPATTMPSAGMAGGD